MTFSEWWEDLGQRTIAFDARGFAQAGWVGHERHSGPAPLDDEQKLLKEKNDTPVS